MGRGTKEYFKAGLVIGLAMVIIYAAFIQSGAMDSFGKWIGTQLGTYTPPTDGTKPTIPDGFVYSGRLKIYLPQYQTYNASAITAAAALADVYIYHADKTTVFGTETGGTGTVTGSLSPEDVGVLWMVLDNTDQTSWYFDADEVMSNYIVEGPVAWDHDDDGTDEYAYKLDFSEWLGPKLEESAKEVTINLWSTKYDSSPSITSSVNSTAQTTSEYNDVTCELYLAGWDTNKGTEIKITRVQLTFANSTHVTHIDDGYHKLKKVSLGYGVDKTWTWTSYTWSKANSWYEMNIGVSDVTEEFYGKTIRYERGASARFATAKVEFNTKGQTGHWLEPVLKIYYINPAGTVASMTGGMKIS